MVASSLPQHIPNAALICGQGSVPDLAGEAHSMLCGAGIDGHLFMQKGRRE